MDSHSTITRPEENTSTITQYHSKYYNTTFAYAASRRVLLLCSKGKKDFIIGVCVHDNDYFILDVLGETESADQMRFEREKKLFLHNHRPFVIDLSILDIHNRIGNTTC